MKKLLGIAFALLSTQAFAADNTVVVTPGSGVTMKSKDIGAGVQAMQPILSDASGNTLLTTVGADAVSNTLTGIPVYSRLLTYNGTTWDRWQGAVTATLAAETTKVIGTVRIASGGVASGSFASGAFASGSVSSGAVASGAFASGALASGSVASGAMVDLGAQADSAAAADTSTASLIALVKRTNQNLTTLNTTAGAAATLAAATTGGASTVGNIAANNTTAVVVKASAGTLYGIQVYGIGSAPAYLKIYNATSATCGSGTPVKRIMIPAASTAANGAGSNVSFGDIGVAFGTGITYCVTTGIGDADTTAPAASTFLINIDYK